jgi:hypothetical protein
MPGEVRQLTMDELEKLEEFPLPQSGTVRLTRQRSDEYVLDCTGLSGADLKRLQDFYERMGGAFHAFCYTSGSQQFPHCRFGQGSVGFIQHGPNDCSVRFMLVVLPPYTTPSA